MPKKKSTSVPQPEPKKLQVLALKKNPSTPAVDAQEKIEASITTEIESKPPQVSDSTPTPGAEVKVPDVQRSAEVLTLTSGAEVKEDALSTPVVLSDALVVLEPEPTPEVEVKLVTDAQPVTEIQALPVGGEVKPDAPAPTPGAKSVRPVLKKKSDRPADVEASSETRTTPELLEAPPDGAIFQAVGVIVGEVTFDDEGKATVAIGEKVFPLFYAPQKKKAYEALRMELKTTGVARQRLMVYPRVMHFPKREEPHRIAFQLVGFLRVERDANPNEITSELGDFEFKLSGLWQFIPVCQTPCVSVFKNYTTERKDFIKEADVAVKVNFMKASHAPLMWKDAPVKPFRFNPKLDKEHQGHAAFVQVKARFDPDKDVFQFLELISTPASNPPRFLKAGKKDKLQVASEKLRAAKAAKGDKVKPQVVKK